MLKQIRAANALVHDLITKSGLDLNLSKHKKFVVPADSEMASELLDDEIAIEYVIPQDQMPIMCVRLEGYLEGSYAPLLGTLGDGIFCIGTVGDEAGLIAYLDIEFGFFKLNASLVEFVEQLVN